MSDQIQSTPKSTQPPEGVEYVQAQVICAGVSYFTSEEALGANGQPLKDAKGDPMQVTLRHEAVMEDVIELSQYEFDRLAALGAVREPSSAPLRPALVATPFGMPVPNLETGELAAYEGPIMGDPRPAGPASASDIELRRGRPAALAPEEAARLERMALGLEDANGNPMEADDVDLEAREEVTADEQEAQVDPEAHFGGENELPAYEDMTKSRLEGLAEERGLEVEGTGANGNVTKDDLVMALAMDDESDE